MLIHTICGKHFVRQLLFISEWSFYQNFLIHMCHYSSHLYIRENVIDSEGRNEVKRIFKKMKVEATSFWRNL